MTHRCLTSKIRLQALVILALAVTAIVTVYVYQPGLSGPLLFDDLHTLLPLLRPEFQHSNWSSSLSSSTGILGRPVAMASFLLNAALSDNPQLAWKTTNLAIHLLIAVLLYQVTSRLLSAGLAASPARVALLSCCVTALWALHPVHVSTVLYTVQRMAQLSAFFVLAGVFAYLWGRQREACDAVKRLALASPFVFFTPLAVLSKENGALLPLFILLLEIVLPTPRGDPCLRQIRTQLQVGVWCPAILALAYLLMGGWERILAGYSGRDFTLSGRLMTEARVIWHYLGMIVIPSPGRLGFFHDDLAVSRSLSEPATTLWSLLGLVALGVLCLLARRRAPVVTFGLAMFLLGHVLESTIIPLELMFEHRNYLPSCGLLIALAGCADSVRTGPASVYVLLGVSALMGAFAYMTAIAAYAWASEETMYAHFYQAHPTSPHAASHFSQVLSSRGHYQEAHAVLQPIGGAGAEIHRWYLICRETGILDDSRIETGLIDREKVLKSYVAVGLVEVSNLALDGKCQLSMSLLGDAVARASKMPAAQRRWRHNLMFYLAHLRWMNGQKPAALGVLADLAERTADDPLPYFLMAEWKSELGDAQGARAAFIAGQEASARSGRDYSRTEDAVRLLLQKSALP